MSAEMLKGASTSAFYPVISKSQYLPVLVIFNYWEFPISVPGRPIPEVADVPLSGYDDVGFFKSGQGRGWSAQVADARLVAVNWCFYCFFKSDGNEIRSEPKFDAVRWRALPESARYKNLRSALVRFPDK